MLQPICFANSNNTFARGKIYWISSVLNFRKNPNGPPTPTTLSSVPEQLPFSVGPAPSLAGHSSVLLPALRALTQWHKELEPAQINLGPSAGPDSQPLSQRNILSPPQQSQPGYKCAWWVGSKPHGKKWWRTCHAKAFSGSQLVDEPFLSNRNAECQSQQASSRRSGDLVDMLQNTSVAGAYRVHASTQGPSGAPNPLCWLWFSVAFHHQAGPCHSGLHISSPSSVPRGRCL